MPTKILAIDDSKTIRLAIKITFAAEDAEVTAVSRGSEAVARAEQIQPNVILVDHNLGDGEPAGSDLCRQLARDPATRDIPTILMVPTRNGPIGPEVLRDCGAAGSIGKPFDSQELIDQVKAVLSAPRAAARPAAAKPAAAPRPAPQRPPAATRPAPQRPAPAPAAARPRPQQNPVQPAPVQPAARRGPSAGSPGRTLAPGGVHGLPGIPPAGAQSPSAAGAANLRARPAQRPAVSPQPNVAPSPDSGSTIPIAVPIPFTAATSPTPGMLARLEAAAQSGAGAEGLDPMAVQALVQLSREVVERIAWEVVPELAEMVTRERQ